MYIDMYIGKAPGYEGSGPDCDARRGEKGAGRIIYLYVSLSLYIYIYY